MKWIGQNIYDLVSRFRNDVYLEDISSGTIASGAHLGLDSNNKIVKATDGGGDLTSIVAGTGLSGTSLTGPIPTLNVDASQTQITGVGTITTGVWNGTAIASAYLDTDTAHLSGSQTFTGTKTLNSFKGTGGATVTNILDEDAMGSDSATALVTQQSAKAYVDARYSYQYVTFIGNSDIATNWALPAISGANANNWNVDSGEAGVSVDSTTVSLARNNTTKAFTVPFTGVLVGFYGTIRNNDANNVGALGLWHTAGSNAWGSVGSATYTLRAYAAGVSTGGSNIDGSNPFKGANKAIDLGRSLALTAGDIIIPSALEATANKVYFTITMVIKTLVL